MNNNVGRPKKADADKKSIRLEIRLTEAENQILTDLSDKLGLSKTDTIMMAVKKLAKRK